MRHLANSKAWKNFDKLHQKFTSKPRNVRFGFISDRF